MNSIGNSFKNFFRTTVQIGNSASAAIADKSVIRQALMKGCGFFGMLAGMKAIRQANCDLSAVETKNLSPRLGKAIEMMREQLTGRDAYVADAKSFKVKADTSTLEKVVKDGTFKEALDTHEAKLAEQENLLTPDEDDPFWADFYEPSENLNNQEFIDKLNQKIEDNTKNYQRGGQNGALGDMTTKIGQEGTNVINVPANNE